MEISFPDVGRDNGVISEMKHIIPIKVMGLYWWAVPGRGSYTSRPADFIIVHSSADWFSRNSINLANRLLVQYNRNSVIPEIGFPAFHLSA